MNPYHLSSPLFLGKAQLKNRLCFAGHITNLSDGPELTKQHLSYFEERLSGGIGLLVSDPLPVHPSSDTLRTKLALTKNTTDSFKQLTKACHRKAVPAVVQLYHVGAHGCAKTSFTPAWSPSGKPSLRDQDGSHKMLANEIEILVDSFVSHARVAHEAGFDGVEIVAGGNMLMEQFWAPHSNQRQDKWGGSFEKRMAFSCEVVKRIREATGPEFLIGLIMTTNQGYNNTLSTEELEKILTWHDAFGYIDYYSFCIDDSNATNLKRATTQCTKYRSLLSKGHLRIDGNLRTPEIAESLLQIGAADFIGMTRALIADPSLMDKYLNGKRQEIRPCIRCNQGCIGRRARDYTVACLVNPSAGRELLFPSSLPKIEKPLKILVAGGGLAGMEAAYSAAEAGHQVSLVERGKQLGGQWRLASQLPIQQFFKELLEWYTYQFDALGIDTTFGKELSGKDLAKDKFDHFIIATGAGPTQTGFQRPLPNRSMLPGVESNNVFSVETVLEGITELSGNNKARVLILDDVGFRPGIGTALFLAELGHKVSLLTRHGVVAPELQPLGGHDKLLDRLKQLGVETLTNSVLLSWADGVAEHAGGPNPAPVKTRFDFLVLATTNEANQQLENEAAEQKLPYSLAGDCQGARKALLAIYEGRKAVMALHQGE